MFYCTFQHDRSNAACLRHGRHGRCGNQTEWVRSHAHTACDRAKLLWKQSHVNWLRYAHTITWFHFLFGFECVRLPYFSRAQPIRLPVTHKKPKFFFFSFIAALFGENEMSIVFSHTVAKLLASLCMTVHKMLFIRFISNFIPILPYELFAWKSIEKVFE